MVATSLVSLGDRVAALMLLPGALGAGGGGLPVQTIKFCEEVTGAPAGLHQGLRQFIHTARLAFELCFTC